MRNAYGRDLARFGPGFAEGDGNLILISPAHGDMLIYRIAEARSSLSAILFRLNAGFVSVIERFTVCVTRSSSFFLKC